MNGNGGEPSDINLFDIEIGNLIVFKNENYVLFFWIYFKS